ncbi:hypothetical protein EW026_g2706 [Hermanssonia centrifuga]|uniref:Uncharacterized protein n=1 Tax=Hermanssonia centrifuga TaxID=98765 RepID=A0A4S4KN08_9APHY|nr:hypothetical protein EW026_g2706 [Hermanssonia centrifuga]
MPAVYGILTDDQLRFLMTSVLAIPLMRELPTPNARKTCALAIWLIQVQRLPGDVLAPIKDDIAYALGRGIGGELGKEGKKGSATDGLKAIHDLCVYYPEIFVPAFTDLLPSIFSSLLAPTLVLRTQACHALGGFSLAAASIPTNAMHTHIANHVAEFLTKTPLGTPSKKPASPSKDPAIVRTLRTTLGATDPKHVAQGPVWALSVIANFIVLLRSTVYLQEKLTKCITSLFSLAMRHPKSSVRGLGCLVWRCMTWAYFQPPPIKIPTTRDDAEAPSQNINTMDWNMEYTAAERAAYIRRMDETWDVVKSVTDMGAGIATMGATLAIDVCDDPETPLRRTFSILSIMSKKGGLACKEALDTACHFVNPDPQVEDDSMLEWNPIKLLPPALFSANPGLLTAEYNVLNQAVKPILAQCPGLEDMRRLTRDELTTPWVFSAVLNVWKEGLASLKVVWGAGFPNEIRDVWSGLFRANACSLSDAGEEEILLELAHRAVDILIIILKNNKINLSAKSESEDEQSTIPWINPKKRLRAQATPRELHVYRWKPALKLALVRELWLSVRSIFPGSMLLEPARKLLACLNAKEANMVIELDVTDDVRAQWAYLCAEVAFVCDDSELMGFWREEKHSRQWSAKMHSFVFSHFVYKWREDLASWESSVALLSTPFMNSWEMKNDDLDEWDALLRLTMDRALDYGVDSITVVDQVAAAISAHHSPTHVSSTRIADLLLSHLDITDARHIPTGLFEFINDTLVSTYPPEPRNKVPSIWLLRTLTRTMDACPVEFAETLLELVQDGLCLWISDEYQSLDHSEYAMDVLPVYQTATLCIMSLPRNIETLARLAPVLVSAFSGREDKPEGPIPAFQEMWEAVYATESEPADGWPEKLLHCLRATGIKEVEATVPPAAVPDDIPEDSDTQDDDEVDAQLGYNVPSDDGSLSPVIPSPRTLE